MKNAAKEKHFQIISSKSFTEPVKITLGIDTTTNKFNTIQYVPILKTITRVLKHEDVLSHFLHSELSRNDSRIGHIMTMKIVSKRNFLILQKNP